MKNLFSILVFNFVSCIALTNCAQHQENAVSQEKTVQKDSISEDTFVTVRVSIPTLNFNSDITFDPDKFAKVSWYDRNDSNNIYQIYLHCSENSGGERLVNAMLFKQNKNEIGLISDNLKELYGSSRELSGSSNIEVITSNIKAAKAISINADGCCTSQCANGRTMTCCNSCCSDPTQGCPWCCAN